MKKKQVSYKEAKLERKIKAYLRTQNFDFIDCVIRYTLRSDQAPMKRDMELTYSDCEKQ